MYTNFESFLANFSFLILFISMLVYWIQASNFQSNKFNNEIKNEQSLVASDKSIFGQVISFKNIGTALTLIANISLFLLLLFRWKESGHFPLSNLYESLMFLSWALTGIHLAIDFGF